MVHAILTVKSSEGLRGHTAVDFAQVASSFDAQLFIEQGNKKVNAKSVIGLLSLAVCKGETIHLFANGQDEEDALAALEQYLEQNA